MLEPYLLICTMTGVKTTYYINEKIFTRGSNILTVMIETNCAHRPPLTKGQRCKKVSRSTSSKTIDRPLYNSALLDAFRTNINS